MNEQIDETINEFIAAVGRNFREFRVALAMHYTGANYIAMQNDNVQGMGGLDLGNDTSIESIPIAIVKQYAVSFPFFLTEVFQNQLVQTLNDFLNLLFELLLEMHLTKKRQFKELKTQTIKIDIASIGYEELPEEVRNSIVNNFKFEESENRLKLINKVFNVDNSSEAYLKCIKKHILVRNCIQHRNGIVDKYMLDRMGEIRILLLDGEGIEMPYFNSNRILLYPAEIDSFKRSLMMIAQTWLTNLANV